MSPVELVPLIFAVLLGLAFGSFLNVCVVRLPRRASIVAPPSHCPSCQTPIRPKDNIPILSWLLLRGRCRSCAKRISLRYPLVEAATAILFAACFIEFGPGIRGVAMVAFCWLLLGLGLIDAETFLLPDAFTLPGLVLGFLYNAASADGILRGLSRALLGAAAIGGVLLLIGLLYRLVRRREGMGFGDVKLGAMLGAWLGWQLGSVALFLAIVGGAVGGLVLVLTHSRSTQVPGSLRVPFGMFLAAAGTATVFFGSPLLRWYLGKFPY
jgi:leader peptidase (prepilin peptidase)/N-methyltransferase